MINVLIVDDERPARQRLRKLLEPHQQTGRVKVVGEAADGIEGLEIIEADNVDLVLLDVRMPEVGGFDLVERLNPENRPAVVFVTAYDEYAVRAFEANAVDYLLKPISADRLNESLNRVERLVEATGGGETSSQRLERLLDWIDAQAETGDAISAPGGDYIKQISIPYRDRILIVPIEKLVTVEISEGITRLFVVDDDASGPKPRLRQHIVNYTLEQLESNLNPEAFMRVHRSTIAQISHILEMIPWFSGRYKLMLTGGHEVIASRERSKQLKERLML